MLRGSLALAIFLACQLTQASEGFKVKVIRGENPIEALEILTEKGFLPIDPEGAITLKGKYLNPERTLIINAETAPRNVSSEFSYRFLMNGPKAVLPFSEVDPFGAVISEKVKIEFEAWPSFAAEQAAEGRKMTFGASLGPSLISFQQTSKPEINEVAVTAKLSASKPIVENKWVAAANIFGTAFVLSNDAPESARFLGVNLRAGRLIQIPKSAWRFAIWGGWYYTTMIGSDNFGYSNLQGPQLYPSASYTSGRRQYSAFFKFSPVTDRIIPLSLRSNEISFGVGASQEIEARKRVHLDFDFSTLSLNFSGAEISNRAISLSAGYSF